MEDYFMEDALEEFACYSVCGTRRVPQFDTSDGRTHPEIEAIYTNVGD
jgi:hypothetical protein